MTMTADPPLADHQVDQPTTVRVRLWGWAPEHQVCVNSLLFGEMVRRAQDTLRHYQGDLYRDAAWMARHVTGPTSFWWVHREWGTDIGGDFEIMLPAVLNANRGNDIVAFRIDLVVEEGLWSADFTRLPTLP